MYLLILGLLVFFAGHATGMVAPRFRAARIEQMGEGPWKGLHSLVALVGLAIIVWGWTSYRIDAPEIYAPPSWGRQVTHLLVLLAFISMVSAYSPAGRIKAAVRHPFLAAVILWSLGHLLANGDQASVLLFGSFLVFAVWNRFAVAQRNEPAPAFEGYRGDAVAVIGGGVAYAIFAIWLHGWLFGVSPF